MVASYDQLAVIVGNQASGEGSSNPKAQVNTNPFFEGSGGIQTRTHGLNFLNLMGLNPWNGSLGPTILLIQIALFHMEGKALSWYCWLMGSSPVHTWEEFVAAL